MPMLAQLTKVWQRPWLVNYTEHLEGVLGTRLDLQIKATQQTHAHRASQAMLGEISRLEQIFSRFLPNSELNRFLATQNTPFALSGELEFVLLHALEWQRRSGGGFHLGADALAQVWRNASSPPSQAELEPILAALKQPLLELGIGYAIRCSSLGINLNAIAKGYIADCAAQVALQQVGVREVLVNLGGDLLHRGHEPVTVSIANPYSSADNAAPLVRVQICNQGIATSGHTQRFFWLGNKRVSHLFDPRTGQPVERVLAASVIAPNAMTADALATVCSVLSPTESLELLHDQPQVGVCVVEKDTVYRNLFWKNHQR